MALTVDQLADITTVTLASYERGKITDLASDLQEFMFLPKFSEKGKHKIDAGETIKFEVLTDQNDSARHMGYYDLDTVNIPSIMTSGSFPWRGTTSNYGHDSAEPHIQSATAAKLKDIIEVRQHGGDYSMFELMETTGWSKPADSSDTETPYGIPMYVVKATSASTGAFSGGNPVGFTSGVGNINSTNFPRYANWNATYTNITEPDFFRNLRQATVFTNFKAPVSIATHNTGDNYEYYTNWTVLGQIEEYLMSNNQNLGNDATPKRGAALLSRTQIQWVPKLEDDSSNPFYGINWGELKIFILEGFNMKKTIKPDPQRRHVVVVHNDVRWNLVCRNRRRNFVLNTI